MRLIPLTSKNDVGQWSAHYIASKINEFAPSASRPFVLGLPTGSTPLATYNALISLYQEGKVSFKYVITFNMDEYVGIPPEHPQSYHTFMHQHFFRHIDIQPHNIHLLSGMAENPEEECQHYEDKIRACGGIRLFLGGVGHDGHIAFNEPGSSLCSRTRIKTLTEDTRIANSRFFDNDINQVPRHALTIGVGTLMDAREVVILVTGQSKALALKAAVEGSVNHLWTISALQMHQHAMILCDDPSTGELRVKTLKYFTQLEKHNIKARL
ncbi:Glucosamine-6-phosphate deaminase [invertebrate metagenome]|uniref:Glucosamine-6-phosphate deaminase n=1 Tax=invertebrate metagenome TaxID=1711999 RepID=A0A2H9T763_9ZZZZ